MARFLDQATAGRTVVVVTSAASAAAAAATGASVAAVAAGERARMRRGARRGAASGGSSARARRAGRGARRARCGAPQRQASSDGCHRERSAPEKSSLLAKLPAQHRPRSADVACILVSRSHVCSGAALARAAARRASSLACRRSGRETHLMSRLLRLTPCAAGCMPRSWPSWRRWRKRRMLLSCVRCSGSLQLTT